MDFFRSESEISQNNLLKASENLKEAKKILDFLKSSNSKNYEKALKEYKELEDIYKKSKESENKITKEEIEKIEAEFEDIEKLESITEKAKRKAYEITSSAIDIINDNDNEKNVLKDLKEYGKKINDPFLKKYILEEINKLENGGKKTDWSILMQTLAMHKKYDVGKIHNDYQDKLISKILGSNKGFNSEYVQGFNNETSNFLIKISDFEKFLKAPSTKIDSVNDNGKYNENTVNSKALASYITSIIEKNGNDIYKSILNLKKVIGENKLNGLADIWNKSDNTIAQNILNKDHPEIIQLIKNPNKILDINSGKNNELYSAIEIGGNDYIKKLEDFIKQNKDTPGFEEKLTNFYKIISGDSCPGEIKSKVKGIIDIIKSGKSVDSQIIRNQEEIYKKDSKTKESELANFFESELLLGNQSYAPGLNKPTNSTKLNINLPNGSNIEKSITPDKLISELNSITDETQINRLISKLKTLDNCGLIIFGVKVTEIYKILSNKLKNIIETETKVKMEKFIISKGKDKETAKKITNEIFEKISGNDCTFDNIKYIREIFQKNGLDISFEDKGSIYEIIKNNFKIQENDLDTKLYILLGDNNLKLSDVEGKTSIELEEFLKKNNINAEDISKILDILNKQNKLKKAVFNNEIVNNSNEIEYDNLLENIEKGKKYEEIMQDLKSSQEKRGALKDGKIINNTLNEEKTLNPIITSGNAQYNTESGSAIIGEKVIELSIEEQNLVNKNPETLKNIVDFYSTLNKVGLAKLWPLKEQIFNVIFKIKGIGFRFDKNYLSENITKIFLNAILKSTGEETINPILGINDFVANIERKNNTQFSGAEAQVNKSGDTKIEQKFISSFAPRGNLLGFDSPAFEQKIRS